MRAFVRPYVRACVRACERACVRARIRECVRPLMHVRARACVRVCVYVRMHVHRVGVHVTGFGLACMWRDSGWRQASGYSVSDLGFRIWGSGVEVGDRRVRLGLCGLGLCGLGLSV
jgi:hypothetical protein